MIGGLFREGDPSVGTVTGLLEFTNFARRGILAVRTGNYVRDAGDVPPYNQIYRDDFRELLPARTTIANRLRPRLRFEMEYVAVNKLK